MACCSKGPLAQVNKDTIKAGVPALALPQFRQDTSSCAFSVLVSVSPVLLSLVNFYELSQALRQPNSTKARLGDCTCHADPDSATTAETGTGISAKAAWNTCSFHESAYEGPR